MLLIEQKWIIGNIFVAAHQGYKALWDAAQTTRLKNVRKHFLISWDWQGGRIVVLKKNVVLKCFLNDIKCPFFLSWL